MNTQTLSLLLENKPGALARVVGTVSGQGWNIVSLTAAPSEDATFTRATMVAQHDADPLTQIRMVNKLKKLIPTISASDISLQPVLSQEMALIRLSTSRAHKILALRRLVKSYGAALAAATRASFEIQAVGSPARIDQLVAELNRHGNVSLARSGLVALSSHPAQDE